MELVVVVLIHQGDLMDHADPDLAVDGIRTGDGMIEIVQDAGRSHLDFLEYGSRSNNKMICKNRWFLILKKSLYFNTTKC